MKRWKIMLAGASGAGKSTLCKLLIGHERDVVKTQSPEYHASALVDLPGEFLTHPHLRHAFLACAQDVEAILYLHAADSHPLGIPAGLLHMTPGLVLAGVITKIDLPDAKRETSRAHLISVGLEQPFFEISMYQPKTVSVLRQWLIERRLLEKDDKGAHR